MILDMDEGASSELAKARGPRDDLAHEIRPDFVATEPKKFTIAQKLKYGANVLFRYVILNASLRDQPLNQFFHIGPPSTGYAPAPCLCLHIDPLRDDLQAMTAFGTGIRFRSQASVAAMQDKPQIAHGNCREQGRFMALLYEECTESVNPGTTSR